MVREHSLTHDTRGLYAQLVRLIEKELEADDQGKNKRKMDANPSAPNAAALAKKAKA
jgi:hypothetical protein